MASLRARLLLLVAVVFIPSILLLLALVQRERTLRLESAQAIAMQYVAEGIRAQQEEIENGLRILLGFGGVASIRTGNAAECNATLVTLAQLIDEGWSVVRTRADGIQDCATRRPETLPRDVSQVPTFARVLPLTEPSVGGYLRAMESDELVVPLNVPLRAADGQSLGVLSLGLRLRWFRRLQEQVLATPGAVLSVFGPGDSILLRAPALTSTDRRVSSTDPLVVAIHRDSRGVLDADGVDGVARVWAFDRLPVADDEAAWLLVGLPAEAVYAGANAQVRGTLIALGFWLTLVIIVAWWATDRFVLRDVRALLAATERIGAGDLTSRTGLVVRTDELARLATSVDTMAARLQERQERQAQAQKLESIGQLAGGVAHDFNNLLTAIIGNAELARDAVGPEHPAHEELDEVLGAAELSASLARQLLAFARRTDLAPRVVRIDQLLEELSTLLQRLIGEHITLRLELAPELPLARVDPTAVEQAVLNLVVNARDAIPPDGGTITLAARPVLVREGDPEHAQGVPTGSWLAIEVHDTGHGMAPQVLAHVFEPFFTTKPVGQGTGLGLAMVYGTVTQHQGHIRVDSAPGRGASFTLYFPPAPADAVPDVIERERPPVAPATARRILLVEDEDAVRAVVRRVLVQAGFEVHVAEHGAQALAWCEEGRLHTLDLLVTDVVMPVLGGVELVTALRAQRADLPVLFVSGYRETHALDALLVTPRTSFLEKPFTPATLLGAVHDALHEVPAAPPSAAGAG
jgi:signal transduction histidine kinase/ActR/RegA family two-component response regulator